MQYWVKNASGLNQGLYGVTLRYAGRVVQDSSFTAVANTSVTRTVTVDGKSELPDYAPVSLSLYQQPEEGVEVYLDFTDALNVTTTSLPLSLYFEPMVRGTDGEVSFVLRNTGTARAEIITAASESAVSPDVTLLLEDASGNVLTSTAMTQRTQGVVRVSSGQYVAHRAGCFVYQQPHPLIGAALRSRVLTGTSAREDSPFCRGPEL